MAFSEAFANKYKLEFLASHYDVPSIAKENGLGLEECARNIRYSKFQEIIQSRIDVLINNAGIAYIGLLTDMTDEDWNRMIQTNLSSVFYCSRAALPGMISKKAGKIINISSMWGTVGASCEVAYSASKSGIHGFTRALAKELAPSNIQVNAIACGCIDTIMNSQLDPDERLALEEEIPAGRFGTPQEIADFVLHLVNSPAYLTGQIIGIDGGYI